MTEKRILISEAKEGMELASDLYDDNGRLIVLNGTVLNGTIIRKIKNYNIIVIKIAEKSQTDKTKYIEENGYFEKIKAKPEFRKRETKFKGSVSALKSSLNDIVVKNAEIDIVGMLKGVKEIIESNNTGDSMFNVLNCMRDYDDLTYVHSMNVALICNVFAGWLGYSQEDRDLITIAGLLHDIGKVKIPINIINKPAKLTDKEYEVIKLHPLLGYEILKQQHIDKRIKYAALMHHERYDGSGYPGKYKGRDISEIARIVAVADVYDAMTSNRIYREAICPFDVIDYFEKQINVFDPSYLLLFLKKTAETYVSNKVLLSDGRQGKIALINNNSLGKPIVIVENTSIDLSKNKEIKIIKLL